MKYFLIDGDTKIYYKQLVSDLNNRATRSGAYGDVLSILKKICKDDHFNDIDELLLFLERQSESLKIEINTSGTTGEPKKITQKFSNVIRHVKKTDEKYVWGFAYNPIHFAGLQVLFQAMFNKNTLVFVFDKDFKQIPSILEEYKVTHISSTPTFMNMLLPYLYEISSLKVISFGGERLSQKTIAKTRKLFPTVKIRNIYASSEAGSVLSSDDVGFYIPDRYSDLIKISASKELCIHKELLGKFELKDEWYQTGDYIKYVDDTHFVFEARSSEIINTGGYRVSLPKVEKYIKSLEGVFDAIVYGRSNSIIGTIIVAEIVSNVDCDMIKLKIKTTDELLEYEKPRVIKFVESIQLTSTGKAKRI